MQISVVTCDDTTAMAEVDTLLASNGLSRDADVTLFAVAREDDRLIGCLGLAGDTVKCAAVAPRAQGENVLAPLLIEIRYQALDQGHPHLFCYTKPVYTQHFTALGFHAIAEVPGLAVLLEDDPRGIQRYEESLKATARPGRRIAGIVMNANPFTRGHEYLIRQAAEVCDVVHVFVVGEDASVFTYAERFSMVSASVASMPEHDTIVVHPGSRYIISKTTFPQYFLKDEADVERAYTGIDLILFREHIAPALGITDRFVGAEPTSAITRRYNEDMAYWLEQAPSAFPPVAVQVVPRLGCADLPYISASIVRNLAAGVRFPEVKDLVPPPTFELIQRKYATTQLHS